MLTDKELAEMRIGMDMLKDSVFDAKYCKTKPHNAARILNILLKDEPKLLDHIAELQAENERLEKQLAAAIRDFNELDYVCPICKDLYKPIEDCKGCINNNRFEWRGTDQPGKEDAHEQNN